MINIYANYVTILKLFIKIKNVMIEVYRKYLTGYYKLVVATFRIGATLYKI